MRLFPGIFRRRQQREETPANPVEAEVKAATVGTPTSLVRVRGDEALSVMAYKRALNILAGSVARLPFRYMRQQNGIYVDFESSPLHILSLIHI